jgi:hypothetical protein
MPSAPTDTVATGTAATGTVPPGTVATGTVLGPQPHPAPPGGCRP